jgi:hypothetical protein
MKYASLMFNEKDEESCDQAIRRPVRRRRDWIKAYLSTKGDPK